MGQKKDTDYLKAIDRNGAYGKGNRPSTPVKGIISGTYGNMAASEIDQKYEIAAQMKKQNSRKNPQPSTTKARQLAAQHVQAKAQLSYANP